MKKIIMMVMIDSLMEKDTGPNKQGVPKKLVTECSGSSGETA